MTRYRTRLALLVAAVSAVITVAGPARPASAGLLVPCITVSLHGPVATGPWTTICLGFAGQ
jgi:hypothetical protein